MTGIGPNQAIKLVTRSNDGNIVEHDALILGTNMNQGLLGANGEPSIEAVFANPAASNHVGTSDWQNALLRVVSVVHVSHPDFAEGRATIGYKEELSGSLANYRDAIFGTATEAAARTAHEANRVLCAIFGDKSHATWDKTPREIQQSMIDGVQTIAADPTITVEQLHESWMQRRLSEGWTYGMTRDPEAKTNPSICKWNDMSPELQAKDHMFNAVARACLNIPQLALNGPASPTDAANQSKAEVELPSSMQNPAQDSSNAMTNEVRPVADLTTA